MTTAPRRVVLCYADRDRDWAAHLRTYLAPLIRNKQIELWDRNHAAVPVSDPAEVEVRFVLADIIVLLISADLQAEREEDVESALRVHDRHGTRILPVQVRPAVLDERLARHGLLPRDGGRGKKARDRLLLEVAGVISRLCGQDTQKVLFLSAVPDDGSPIQLSKEAEEVKRAVSVRDARDRFLYKRRPDVTAALLAEALSMEQPAIAHFTGHGAKGGRLVLLDYQGHGAPVPRDALVSLFARSHRRGTRGVVLCSCYTGPLAEAIRGTMDFVLGIPDIIMIDVAMAFTGGFYLGLSGGESLQESFELGLVRAGLAGGAAGQVPVLHVRDDIDAGHWRLFARP